MDSLPGMDGYCLKWRSAAALTGGPSEKCPEDCPQPDGDIRDEQAAEIGGSFRRDEAHICAAFLRNSFVGQM